VPPRITGEVVVVANPVVVGSVLVVVGPVLVVVGPVAVGSAVVVVSSVVVGSVVVLKAAVVVEAAVVVGAVVLGVVTGGCVVAPGVEWVLVTVVLLQRGVADVVCRAPMVIGRLAADGLVSGLLVGGEGAVVGSVVVLVVKEVDVGAGSVVAVGRATPGARRGGSGWGSRVAEATRAARTAVVSPKATSSSLQGCRGLARCRGRGVGMSIVPVRLLLPGQGCPWSRHRYRAHRSYLGRLDRTVRMPDVGPRPLPTHQPG